jgi:hypothetical protein
MSRPAVAVAAFFGIPVVGVGMVAVLSALGRIPSLTSPGFAVRGVGLCGGCDARASGAAIGLVYRWRRSILAPTVIHFLIDLTALVAAPLVLR